ncbi:MAG: type II toxin-antitoxin system HicA family toxin [Luteolibacter sp.]|jgi:predicted RNA binding protein YcfA (HicA-like mRNA interferase family)|nr:type II toxin-antitoxin system HicA family toxin [Luteolibacter sp.]
MPKRLSSHDFLRILSDHGFKFISQKGSHAKYRDAHGHTVIVPHPRKDIPIGTVRSMIRQSGLPSELFE